MCSALERTSWPTKVRNNLTVQFVVELVVAVCSCRADFIDTQTCYRNGNPLICPSMKDSGVDLYQYSETLLRASHAQSGLRWAVEAAFSRAKLDLWIHCPVRRAATHYAEDIIRTSRLNALWY